MRMKFRLVFFVYYFSCISGPRNSAAQFEPNLLQPPELSFPPSNNFRSNSNIFQGFSSSETDNAGPSLNSFPNQARIRRWPFNRTYQRRWFYKPSPIHVSRTRKKLPPIFRIRAKPLPPLLPIP